MTECDESCHPSVTLYTYQQAVSVKYEEGSRVLTATTELLRPAMQAPPPLQFKTSPHNRIRFSTTWRMKRAQCFYTNCKLEIISNSAQRNNFADHTLHLRYIITCSFPSNNARV